VHPTRRGLAAVLALSALLLAVPAAFPASAAGARPSGPLVPESGAFLGMWAKPRDGVFTRATQEGRWRELEAAAGRTFDIGHTFYPWETPFPTWREPWHIASGRIPLISWNGTFTSEIAAGAHDALIRERADAVKALGAPVFLRWFWEMDGRKKADWAQTPGDYIAAWRHIHAIFAERGATNAVWVWCPNASAFASGEAPQWYPGDGYVDWVCGDGYNWAPGRPKDAWRSLTDIFAAFHSWGMAQGKPMMIGETGVQERDAGEKPAWFAQALAQLQTDLPGIAAVVYFDSDNPHPWWVDSTPESLAAFAAVARDPYLNPRTAAPAPPPPPAPTPSAPPSLPATPSFDAAPRQRLAGGDRIATATAVSRATFSDAAADAVVLARADHYADALAGAPLAVAGNAPLLLTTPQALPDGVLAEIQRVLGPGGRVHLLGGPAAIAPAVADALRAAGFAVARHAGSDRYATAVAIANALPERRTLLLATGTDFPDALIASGAAAAHGGAVLLTDGSRLPAEVAAYLAAHPNAARYAVGAPAAAAAPGTTAVSGLDHYATSTIAAATFFPDAAHVALASGVNFPDALAGAPHAARAGAPLLLTAPDALPAPVAAYLAETQPATIWIYGGQQAVHDEVFDS
jgi:putative cell wall-binding protein